MNRYFFVIITVIFSFVSDFVLIPAFAVHSASDQVALSRLCPHKRKGPVLLRDYLFQTYEMPTHYAPTPYGPTYDYGTYSDTYDSGTSVPYEATSEPASTQTDSRTPTPPPPTPALSPIPTPTPASPLPSGFLSGFSSAGSGYAPPTSNLASSDILQGTSSVAGGYGLAGMETFGDMFGNSGNGGSITEITREDFFDIISFNVEKGISLSIGDDSEVNGKHSWSLSGLTFINSETQKRYEGYSIDIHNANAYPYTFDNNTGKFIKNPDYDGTSIQSDTEPIKNSESLRAEALNYFYEKYAHEDLEDVNICGVRNQLWVYYNLKNGERDVFVDEDSNSYYSYDVSAVRLLYSQRTEYTAALSQSVVGRIRITENLSPLPQNRFIFDYSGFRGVPSGEKKFEINRFTVGMERTLINGLMSIEARLPIAATLDTRLESDGSSSFHSMEIGDLSLTAKALLYRTPLLTTSCGVTLTIPTGNDVRYYDSSIATEVMRYKNDTTHIMPYIGGIWTPNNRYFTQAYAQLDFDGCGRSVYSRQNPDEQFQRNGRTYDNTYFYGSLSSGVWMYRNPHQRYGLTGWNLIGELHWTHALDSSKDVVVEGKNYEFNVGNFTKDYDVLNATLGTRFVLHQNTVLGVAYGFPLSSEKQFDGEARVTFNCYF